jgi:hypothetical protein
LLVSAAEDIGVNRYTVTNLHALLADNLLSDPRSGGRLRDTPVAIAATTYVPTAIPRLIAEIFARLLLLRDVFVWAYERSAKLYRAVRDSSPEPDPFRLKYRNALTEIAGEAVRRRLRASVEALAEIASPLVPQEDLGRLLNWL